MESIEETRNSKKIEAADHLFECIKRLRSASGDYDVWPWVQLANALAAFEAGLYDLSVNNAQLAQYPDDRYARLPEDISKDAITPSDLEKIEQYLRDERNIPAKLSPRFCSRM